MTSSFVSLLMFPAGFQHTFSLAVLPSSWSLWG